MVNEKPTYKAILSFGIPAVVVSLFDEINNVIDTIFIGQYVSGEAIGAMSVVVPFMIIISAISFLFSEGASIAISRYLGAEDIKNATVIFNTSLFLSVLASFIIGLLSFIWIGDILRMFNLPKVTYNYTLLYLRIIAIAMPVIVVSIILGKMVYTEGYTKTVLFASLFQVILNVFLNYLALAILNLGIIGASIATVLSIILQIIILASFILGKNKMSVRLNIKEIKITKIYFKEVIPLGMASFVTMIFLAFTFGIESRVIASFGSANLAVQTITGNIFSVTSSATQGILSGTLILMGYQVGAKNKDSFIVLLKKSLVIVLFLSCVINIPIIFFPDIISAFFTDNAALINLLRTPMTIYAWLSIFIFSTNVILYAMQPIGMEKTSTVLFALQQMIFFVPLLYIFKPLGFKYAILAQPFAETIGGIITLFLIPVVIKKISLVFSDKTIF